MPSLDKMMMNVDSCCCGCSLRTGTLILLWMSLIGAILHILGMFAPVRVQDHYGNTYEVTEAPVVVYFEFQFVMITGVVAAFGLYGISNRRPSLLLPYVYVQLIQIALFWIVCVLSIILALFIEADIHNNTQQPKRVKLIETVLWSTIFGGIFVGIIACVINWYFTSVVYRYYKQLEASVLNSYQGDNFNAPPRYDAQLKA